MLKTLGLIAPVLLAALLAGCNGSAERDPALLVQRAPAETGVAFENRLAESPELNILNYLYYYNGGGVAAGDVNGDGRVDLYFTANEGPNALYLNRGGFQFEETTEAAGVGGTADWAMGVTMADVNADGRLDIYVSTVSGIFGLEGHNELYINQGVDEEGVPRFAEQAAAYGLDDDGYGTHAAFFDYDGDSDLDAYVLNHSTHDENTYDRAEIRTERHPRAGDRLYRNNGDETFTDVSAEAGIYGSRVGYGLGVAVSDFDGDGCPDLYVANDFHENDYLYFNNCDGTFTETIAQSTGHNSLSSMGADAADVNNDGRPDIAVLDMMPSDEAVRKTTSGNDDEEVYRLKRRFGYHHQLARNTLQLNQGRRRFSEIGPMAGIHATDWSWAALFVDLDNDGWKDLVVTNGIYRRPNTLDYIDYVTNEFLQTTPDITGEDTELMERMPSGAVPNFAFRNEGDLTFTNRSAVWGFNRADVANGAAYADLDNDGDLDFVTNNINAPAAVYENRADTLTDRHYLTVRLDGEGGNTQGTGAVVHLVQGERRQMLEQQPSRGFQSSVDPRLHFGLGTGATVDSLTVVWPDGRAQTRTDVTADQAITLRQAEATAPYRDPADRSDDPRFTEVTDEVAIDYRHAENDFNDFIREPLMPRKLSTEGPALAVGDVNGDGRDDLFAGGARRQPARLFVQQPGGGLRATNDAVWDADAQHEDVDAVFFDADGDDDLDLYVVSGGNEFSGTADALRDRLYRNGGNGDFQRANGALPEEMFVNGGTVAPGDFDSDGDLDLFVGGRVVPFAYGASPASYLLENEGTGRFRDVTAERAPDLAEAGMVADAVWTDATGDGRLDLVAVGEWMPIRVFAQAEGGRFEAHTEASGFEKTSGWWNAIHAADLDGDGDEDLVAGNLGLNTLLKATPDAPVRLYLNDFNKDGRLDPILTYHNDGASYPFYGRDLLARQIEALRTQFPSYEDFGASRIGDLFPAEQFDAATLQEAHLFAHVYAENRGDGTFAVRPLPAHAQVAPVYGILADDFDADGRTDLVLGGNVYGVRAEQGRYDASYGLWLRGTGDGFEAVPPAKSHFYLAGEVRVLRTLYLVTGERLIVAARNDDRLQLVRVQTNSSGVEGPRSALRAPQP